MNVTHGNQKCPAHWKRFLANKVSLVRFLVAEWSTAQYAPHLLNRQVFVTLGSDCNLLSSTNGIDVTSVLLPDLTTDQVEADSRLLLHAKHAATARPGSTIIISSPDTDVLVLCCAMAHKMPENTTIIMKTGTGNYRRYIDVPGIVSKLGTSVCEALLGMHALTGCDSTSAFFGKGKKLALTLLQQNPKFAVTLAQLASAYDAIPEVIAGCQEFVCRLYGSKE